MNNQMNNQIDDNENDESNSNLTKEITLISFGYLHGKPKTYRGDYVISIKNMFSVSKDIRDKYDGTSVELQKALLNIQANKEQYESIIVDLKEKLNDILNSPKDEDINIFIGCEAGKHRSVAVVSMLKKELSEIIKNMIIEDREHKEITLKVEHRDLNNNSQKKSDNDDDTNTVGMGKRKNKQDIKKDRSQKRDAKTKFMSDDY
jgi:RNase adaptor protein for sRNA GlmZ degradation